MNIPTSKIDRKDIGTANVRFPTGTVMPDPLDRAVDPYAPTKLTKSVNVSGFQAWPQKGGPFPAVLILHDAWGLNHHIREIVLRLAQQGYVALAIDQYSRLGSVVTADADHAAQLMNKMNLPLLMQDLNAAVEYLNFQEYVKKNRIVVLGFSMGGSHTLALACARRQIRGAIVFYGNVPLQDLSTLRCPVIFHQAEIDEKVTAHEVEQLASRLASAKVVCEVHQYPGTSHGFFDDTRAEVYHPEASQEAWARTLAFLEQYILADHAGVRPLPDSQRTF